MNFLACNGSFIYFDNNLKILSSVSPGYLTNFLLPSRKVSHKESSFNHKIIIPYAQDISLRIEN